MFMFHVAYALELIALGVGVAFLIWSFREKGHGVILARVFGYIIMILAIIILICSFLSNVAIWRMHRQMMQEILMHQNNMSAPMMQMMPSQKPMQLMPPKPMQLHKPATSAAAPVPHKTAMHQPVPHKTVEKLPVHKPTAVNTSTGNANPQ